MNINLKKQAVVSPLDLVSQVLEELAPLIYKQNDEKYVLLWGIAQEALNDYKKQNNLSYEERDAPHQYYYTEDEGKPSPIPSNEPLQVTRVDVTPRGNRDVGFGLV